MENNERIKESKRKYGKKYNKANINVQLDRELIEIVKGKLDEISLKSYIEDLIRKNL
jgi:hypothetical protein